MRLLTKAGTQGTINLVKLVPVLGGLVSGGMNAVSTRTIGSTAKRFFHEGLGPEQDEQEPKPPDCPKPA